MSVERTVRVNLIAANQQYNRAMQQSGQQTNRTKQQMGGLGGAARGAGRQLLGMAGPLLGATGVVRGLQKATSAQMEFEDSALKLQTQIGLTAGEADGLAQSAREVGVQYGIGAQQAIDASWQIASAGLRGEDAAEALERSAAAAALGFGDVTTVADLATSAMNAYGPEVLSAADATDILATAVREGKAEPEEMAASMGQVLPIAAELGVSFEELAGTQAAMTRTGTNARTAATQLRQVMMDLMNPSDQAREALDEVGLSAQGLRDQIRDEGLFATLMTLRESFEGNEEAMSEVFGNARSLMGVLDLMGSNVGENAKIMEAMANSTGAIDDGISELERTSTRFQMDKFKANIQEAALGSGELSDGLRGVLRIANQFMEFDAEDPFRDWGSGLRTLAMPKSAADAVTSPLERPLVGLLGGSEIDTRAGQELIDHLSALAETGDLEAIRQLERLRDAHDGWQTAAKRSLDATLEQHGAHALLAEQVHAGALSFDEAAVAAGMFGTTADEVARALSDLQDADLDDVGTTLGKSLGDIGAEASGAAGELEWLVKQVEDGELSMDAAEVVAGILGISLLELQDALGLAGDEAEETAEKFDDQADSSRDAAEAIDEYLDAVRRGTDPVFALFDAIEKVDEAQQAYTDAVKEHGPASKEAEDAAVDLMGSLIDLEAAALDGDLSFREFETQLDKWVRMGKITEEQAALIRNRVREGVDAMDDFEGERNAVLNLDVRMSQADLNMMNRWEAAGRASARSGGGSSGGGGGGGSSSGGSRTFGNREVSHAGGWGGHRSQLLGSRSLRPDEHATVVQSGEFTVSRDMMAGRVPVPDQVANAVGGGGPTIEQHFHGNDAATMSREAAHQARLASDRAA